jgi:chaperonin GroES
MKVVPIGENVMVKPAEAESLSAGGIVLPDTAREKPWQGRVLSVSDGRMLPNGERVPHQVAEGDRVLFARHAGTEVMVDGEELLIMSERDILAVIQ